MMGTGKYPAAGGRFGARLRRLSAAALAVLLALALVSPAAAAKVELSDLEDEVMCPICGTALGLSEAPQADRQRVFIRKQIAEGKSKAEIKDALVEEYGPEVLAVPAGSGFDLAAWLVPGIGFAIAVIGIGIGLRRWRRADDGGADPPRISADAADRLDADLAKYDL